ncbi:MAG: bifunctional tRNA (5-methylaminomethyl-2-thiouridine)(34)-methyltransferase MnmD/FAD-dependent 5-carboxymethylaminomethyl-2-thiouridine(34) oxidoreductase MnmC [Betaproteobacteria bacterium]|nr:bifunctional tRNA (5-methylaminomethyl-2-thiouridine)(34)-methyltransferase MnmD/FAD-dependent 5-carboxymethylaminomethyl-2-thiouridine(34) oxidoreductase MnmC [Betaproteobacteria bacterium]
MPSPLAPARLAFAPDGTPYSETFGDVYHSAAGGLAQARHVFLQGNGLPERWRGRRVFTILETGFGFGLSFLATWHAWRADPKRCERLHFVSIEKHPFTAIDFESLLQKFPEIASEAKQLLARWPILVPGMHRIELDGRNVVLTLFFGDVADGLPQLALAADAFFLDGFAPPKNPAMWSPPLLRHLGRLAAPGATLATWSVAAPVREALQGAGFALEKVQGFGTKREMLRGDLIARKKVSAEKTISRSAIVIGAGIAGAAVCERLASRGWEVTLIERHTGPAEEASGNHAGIFHPIISPDDSLFARFTRASFMFLLNHWKNLHDLQWERCGVLQMARNADEKASQQRALATLGYPANYAQFDEVKGGIWFPEAGWVKPRSLVQALLSHSGIETKFGMEVFDLEHSGTTWNARDKQSKTIASSSIVILANASDALHLAPQPAVKLRRVRGQLTLAPAIEGLRHILLRGGMVLPGVDGLSVIGASFDVGDEDPELRADSHEGNLERLEQMLPGASSGLDPASLGGRVAFRAVVRDRLPMIGPIADARGAGLYGAFAYGSRGLLWAGLGGEMLASLLEGEPLPVERKLAAAVDPGRFALRAARRGLPAARQ